MIVIPISGIIARWEMESESNVTPETLRKSLDNANGESVRIDINSPGGDVDEGLEMFSMIKNYSGHTETRVVSMAASMGSVLALAGNKKTAEKTASFMIHNPWGFGIGDYRAFAKRAERLKAVTNHLSNVYTDRANVDNDKIRQMMNDETWIYGEDLTDFNFEIVESENDLSFDELKVSAHSRYDKYIDHIKNHPDIVDKDLERAVASIAAKKKSEIQNIKTPAANAGKNKDKENTSVKNLTDLKAQYPDIFAKAVEFGKAEAMDLVNAHLTLGEACGSIELAVKNIKAGNQLTQTISAEYQAKGMKTKDVAARIDDDKGAALTGEGGLDEEVNEADTQELADDISKGMRGKKKNG